MNRPQPQLDPPRLELAAGLYDMAAWQLDAFLNDAGGYGISPQDAASLQLLVDLIRWHAQGYRRRAAPCAVTPKSSRHISLATLLFPIHRPHSKRPLADPRGRRSVTVHHHRLRAATKSSNGDHSSGITASLPAELEVGLCRNRELARRSRSYRGEPELAQPHAQARPNWYRLSRGALDSPALKYRIGTRPRVRFMSDGYDRLRPWNRRPIGPCWPQSPRSGALGPNPCRSSRRSPVARARSRSRRLGCRSPLSH